jgi:tetratricopeptide (TPR) repeat protein
LRDKLPPDRYLTLGLRELLHSIGLFPDSPALAELRYCAQQILESNRQTALPPLSAEGWESWAEHHEQGYQGLKLMNYPQALAAYEHALGYRDDDPYAWHGLALAQAMGGDAAAAARAWLRCLDLDPEFDFTTLGRVQRHKQ